MDNYEIADQLSLLSKLMEIHGENSFKAKSYSVAAFTVEKLPQQVSEMSPEKIFKLKGIGESVGKKIIEIIDTGALTQVDEYISRTPQGVLEMMNIKGLGPKKINSIWKEMEIDSIEELEKACAENRIAVKKGFGEKTQEKILESIQFRKLNAGRFLYVQVEAFAQAFQNKLGKKFPGEKIEYTGDYRRQMEIVESLDLVTTINKEELKEYLLKQEMELVEELPDSLVFSADQTLRVKFHFTSPENFHARLFSTSCSSEFLDAFEKLTNWNVHHPFQSEEEIFSSAGLNFIPPFLREKEEIIAKAKTGSFNNILQTNEIKGLVHSHSTWSDGAYPLEEMADALIKLGFEYLVISDHSKAAYYANGLTEQRILEQHKQIDELNRKLAPFKIFKSIECDILSDGTLDFEDRVLSLFDLVIVSIHSNLDMDEDKAMKRLLGALSNPYVNILGHMTGRLLLRRKGYPVDHKAIIDACAKNHIAIEINANPNRLDMDWRWVDHALEKELMLSVNPDAHTIEEFHNIRYGVLVAQKGGLPKEKNLSSHSLKEFEDYLAKTKKLKGII